VKQYKYIAILRPVHSHRSWHTRWRCSVSKLYRPLRATAKVGAL